MTTYRQLSQDEIKKIAARLTNEALFDLARVRKEIPKLFGEAAHKVEITYSSEYNDEGYDLVPDFTVYDKKEKVLELSDEDTEDDLWDLKSDLTLSDRSDSDSFDGLTVLIHEKTETFAPELYVKVDT